MKKFSYYFLLALIFSSVSCTNQDDLLTEASITSNEKKSSITRGYNEAVLEAESALNLLHENVTTRFSTETKIDFASTEFITSRSTLTRGDTGDCVDTLLYIFNFKNDNGFAVISASKKTNPVLAITTEGHFECSKPSSNEGLNMFMQMAEEHVKSSFSRVTDPTKMMESELVVDTISCHRITKGPFVSVRWGQDYAEGQFCPNGLCGCVATAIAQIMTYYSWPASIDLTYSGADISRQNLDWNSIKKHPTNCDIDACPNSERETHLSIGRLCRQLGEDLDSKYFDAPRHKTSTNSGYIASCLNIHNYQTNTFQNYSKNEVLRSLDDGHPLIMIGQCIQDKETIGHAWVVDGYIKNEYKIIEQLKYVDTGEIYGEEDSYISNYLLHINWGWRGKNNGYFDCGVFNTSRIEISDTELNPVNLNFNQSLLIICAYPRK